MRLTIVVPIYNVRNAVVDTLASVCRLDPPPHELIVVNDGSTDGSENAAEQFLREHDFPRWRLITQENAGVSVARNNGLDAATGDYVLFLDGDDRVEPHLVEKLILAHSNCAPADVYCWLFRDEKAGSVGWGIERAPSRSTGQDTLQRVVVAQSQSVWTGSAAYAIPFLKEHGLRFTPGCAAGQDHEFIWKALATASSVDFTDAILSTWVHRMNSRSNSPTVHRFDSVLAFYRAAEYIRKRNDQFAQISLAAREKVIREYIKNMGPYLLANESSPRKVLQQIDKRNPGLTHLVQTLIKTRRREGQEVPLGWTLLRVSPYLWVTRMRWLHRRTLSADAKWRV